MAIVLIIFLFIYTLLGVCMLPLIMGKYDGDDACVSQQMEEMCQVCVYGVFHWTVICLTFVPKN